MPVSPLASPSATIDVLVRHGLATRKRLGQHFLVDDNVVGRILRLADLHGPEHVLEIGPGIGTLTWALAQSARSVVSVERDERLRPALEEVVRACPNVRVVFADALDVVPDALRDEDGAMPSALVANLPYSVAATLVLRCFERMADLGAATVMVQAEVADRMAAAPGSKQYGAYTVKLALQASVAGRFPVSRECFLPPPRVDSAVVRLERTRERSARDVEVGSAAADAAFSQRRKTVRNAIASALGVKPDDVGQVLLEEGLDPQRRAEEFAPAEYVRMGHALSRNGLLP